MVEIIHLPNLLKAKVCRGEAGATGVSSAEAIPLAKAVLREYAARYLEEAEQTLSRLTSLFADLKASPYRADLIIELRLEAFDMMGVAEMLGFPRLTWTARSLYDLCDCLTEVSDEQRYLIQLRLDWIERVIRNRVTGYGDEGGGNQYAVRWR